MSGELIKRGIRGADERPAVLMQIRRACDRVDSRVAQFPARRRPGRWIARNLYK
ncbi:hypothetical protein GCM10012287_52410 [Streptomyces daqingensis]|uniref:Uncharacterized protein n=1 Tax=Streptomyces daqingensis TaxID=1472640 RepID=A0ABQ2MSU5_9ACTN|nr:hypothetical protein GCM10012287_52410 [Streptomyces daqingensis]